MDGKILRFIFFGNYFVGLLAVALTLESTKQLRLPYNSIDYYLLLFLAPIIYYTYAYHQILGKPLANNPRSTWYYQHRHFIKVSQIVLLVLCIGLALKLLYHNFERILQLSITEWLAIFIFVVAGALYYGLLPKSLKGLNLRNIGWLKPILIGFVWACCANILPLIMLKIEGVVVHYDELMWSWLFVKNWMFCTVNAIIFDIKDYPTDANKHLKTFVVRLGLRKTIFYLLIPLLLVGMVSLYIFVSYKGFGTIPFLINLLPFILTIYLAYSMRRRKKILYYLVVIDGLILFKAICGITAMQFIA
ncbi:UbiA family prenyltransferase [Pedobacter sp. MC2016-24]|uniref:UbiA family prenyltransferase n=1 Tax=Pedobacter sp. MC2016-24 TaxID=2780090 RepID=UPI00188140D5|nr:UbiA family prenyltransferase [Pedobacter sp. MC2016-24]MBE9598229.1 UbiA family prenyltransferase [Pedobacter sp. MC2016-24]